MPRKMPVKSSSKPSSKSKKSAKRAPKKRATRGDAVTLLEKDHQSVRKLLARLEGTPGSAAKKRAELLREVATEIELHTRIEEEIFYPAFGQHTETKNDEKLFFEAAEEHDLVHGALPAIRSTDPGTELFSARAKVLKDLIEHHADEEEHELFPRARKLMSTAMLQQLGAELEARKAALQNEPLPPRAGNSRASAPRAAAAESARRRVGVR
jgi:hemerythrin-like domain-containing protein